MAISVEKLKELANNLLFEMKEEEYVTLQQEFDVILEQMKLIGEIENVDNLEPLIFPIESETLGLREDVEGDVLSVIEVLENTKEKMMDMVKVQKVVG